MVRKEKCYINCVLLSKSEVGTEVSGPGEGRSVEDQQVQRLEASGRVRVISYTGGGSGRGAGHPVSGKGALTGSPEGLDCLGPAGREGERRISHSLGHKQSR